MTHSHTHAHTHGDSAHMDWPELLPLLEGGAELRAPMYRQAMAWLTDLVPVGGVRRVLDVGSGPGVLSRMLAETFPYAEVVAVDGTPELLERARARGVTTLLADLPGDLPELGEADLIWMGEALHHLGDQEAALAGLAERLRPGGLLALVEGGLPTRHLPRDSGIGRPGLEDRMDAASADWFARMRTELPGSRDVTEDWRALLSGAGLAPSGTRTFLVDIPAPVPPSVRDHVIAEFTRRHTSMADALTPEDRATLNRLLDPDDPASLHHRPDVHLLTARTVHTARKA
ncbi:methyltransferase domain-containing protein [Streptomyces sp. MUM 203J]|uniref:class I SAM-dependent methyltransferase n=1 Tax=Streptomyces sp. MUM 203J TaxID=2791990 RepID=UPI001F042E50|nr:class I SAM-dependent methyltransferase [Streptomyces sp. MUM 203J]MCH0542858.1 methyltransferase domain-containing protein [Streptomyces sp. MUM 203J]